MAGGRGKGKRNGHVAAIAKEIEQSLEENEITLQDLMLLGQWSSCDPDSEEGAIGRQLYTSARKAFVETTGSEVSILPAINSGVALSPDGQIRIPFEADTLPSSTAKISRVLSQLDMLGEEAREWQPDAAPPPPDDPPPKPGRLRGAWRWLIGGPDPARAKAAMRPLSMRVYSLAVVALGAIQQEATRQSREDADSDAGSDFIQQLSEVEGQIVLARNRFEKAAQRMVQSRYWRGMIAGAAILVLACAAIGAAFWVAGADAAYGVALPAGGLGAMVSVLQRMSSGRLVLDIDAGRDLVEAFGAVRPLIGAVFGVALMAILLGGLIPAIEIPADHELAFFAGVGFLAGFNERWAQDMLKGSANHVGSANPERPADTGS